MSKGPVQIYIVDDEEAICTAYARLVRAAKMEAKTFLSVEKFLQEKVLDQNACVICDLAMPGISGLELPGLLASAGRHIPVIFVTAYDTDENRAIAQQAGGAAFFRKPVDDQALLDAIDWVLNPKLNRPAKL